MIEGNGLVLLGHGACWRTSAITGTLKTLFLLAETPLYFRGFRNSFSTLLINLSNRGEISSHQWKNYSENYNEKSRIMLTVKTLMSYKEWLFKVYDDNNVKKKFMTIITQKNAKWDSDKISPQFIRHYYMTYLYVKLKV